jgi:hypothetical protein
LYRILENLQENVAEISAAHGPSGEPKRVIRPAGGAASSTVRRRVVVRPNSACPGKRKQGVHTKEQGADAKEQGRGDERAGDFVDETGSPPSPLRPA